MVSAASLSFLFIDISKFLVVNYINQFGLAHTWTHHISFSFPLYIVMNISIYIVVFIHFMKVRKYLKVFYTSLYVVNSERSMVGWGLYVNLEAFHASLTGTTQLGFGFSTICWPDCSKCESHLLGQLGGRWVSLELFHSKTYENLYKKHGSHAHINRRCLLNLCTL